MFNIYRIILVYIKTAIMLENMMLKNIEFTKLNESEIYEFVCRFEPLLNKYARQLKYSDAYYDLMESLLNVVTKIHRIKDSSAGAVVNYINKSLYHQYIALSKSVSKYNNVHFLFGEAEEIKVWINSCDKYDFINIDYLKRCLTDKEYEIIILHFYYDYSIAEIAEAKKVSRQSVNQTKLIAIKKLRKAYEEMEKI